ncbi:MAG: archease [Thermoplasmatota archaeon]
MFRLVPHTADVAIEAQGGSEGEALAAAATGLTALVAGQDDPRDLPATTEMAFDVEAPDLPALAVAFLSELVWLQEADELLWVTGGVQVTATDDGGLRARARANAAPVEGNVDGGVEVKAVTYHDLAFERRGDGGAAWFLRVVVDL